MRNEKGITLIALVITIIVLLILAGVSIAMLTGENGLLNRATNAGTENKIAEAKEDVMLTVNELVAEFYEKKYVDNETMTQTTPEAYVAANLGSKLNAKYASYADGTITLVPTDPEGNTITGTYDSTSTDSKLGTITWSYPATTTNP